MQALLLKLLCLGCIKPWFLAKHQFDDVMRTFEIQATAFTIAVLDHDCGDPFILNSKTSGHLNLIPKIVSFILVLFLDDDDVILARFESVTQLVSEIKLRFVLYLNAFEVVLLGILCCRSLYSAPLMADADGQQEFFDLCFVGSLSSQYLSDLFWLEFLDRIKVAEHVIDFEFLAVTAVRRVILS